MARARSLRSHLPTLLASTVCLFVLASAPPVAAAPLNDDYANRLTLQLSHADTRSNSGAGIEAAEPFTANDASSNGCTGNGEAGPSGSKMDATLWWELTGTGGPITISTLGSNFDTVLAIYEVDGRDFLACNDDLQPFDDTRPNLEHRAASEILLQTTEGTEYAIQVGGCVPESACGASTGSVTLRASPPPPNDNRANATPVQAGVPRDASNTGSTTEAGELTQCHRFDDKDAPFAKTVWFRFTAPAQGTAIFSASGFDTVLTVYRGSDTTAIGCNDDAVDGQFGPSRLPMAQPAGPPVEVTPGDYYIQVGGYYDPGFSTVAARNGPLQVQVEFNEDFDVDDDGVSRPYDCDDQDETIKPGGTEIPNNDKDEDCDGVKSYDADGDGHLAPPSGEDCDDGDPDSYPGAPELPGDGVDQSCDGADPPNRDHDNDGVLDTPYGGDCNAADPAIRPGAKDIPDNGVDEDCDGIDLVDRDRDRDGVIDQPYGSDCRPEDPAIRPGAKDLPDNGVDEDCDGLDFHDRDRDRDLVVDDPEGPDCDPENPGIRPGAKDIPENGVDEDCDEFDARFPQIGTDFGMEWVARAKTRIVSLTATQIPAGTTLRIQCLGRGCRRAPQHQTIRLRRHELSIMSLLRRTLTRRRRGNILLEPGTRIDLRASHPARGGRGRTYTVLRNANPDIERYCFGPTGAKRPC